MILEHTGLKGFTTDLAHLDEVTAEQGFVRWQWEYRRATYDWKIEDAEGDFYLRFNCRATSGKLESPYAMLEIEDIYIGKATFPHGLDYEAPLPERVRKAAEAKLDALHQALTAE